MRPDPTMTYQSTRSNDSARGAIGAPSASDVRPVDLVWNDPLTGETLRVLLTGPGDFLDRLLSSSLWTAESAELYMVRRLRYLPELLYRAGGCRLFHIQLRVTSEQCFTPCYLPAS